MGKARANGLIPEDRLTSTRGIRDLLLRQLTCQKCGTTFKQSLVPPIRRNKLRRVRSMNFPKLRLGVDSWHRNPSTLAGRHYGSLAEQIFLRRDDEGRGKKRVQFLGPMSQWLSDRTTRGSDGDYRST